MKKWGKWKRVVFIIILSISMIRIGYIVFRGEVEKQYYVSNELNTSGANAVSCDGIALTFKPTKDYLDSIEVIFTDIPPEKKGSVILRVLTTDELIYQTNISLATLNNNEWKRLFVNAPMQTDNIYTISFTTSDDCIQAPNVLLVPSSSPEVISSMYGETSSEHIAIRFGYLRMPGRLDIAVNVSIIFCMVVLFYFGLCHVEEFKRCVDMSMECICSRISKGVFLAIAELLLCQIIITSSGIEFQEPTKIIFHTISLLSVWKYEKRKEFIQSFCSIGWKRVSLCLLYIYAAFSLVGQRILIYPLTVKLSSKGLFVFLITIVWFVPVINMGLYFLNHPERAFYQTHETDHKRHSKNRQVLLLTAFLLVPAAYHLFAVNPGITSPDTQASMITNAHHLHGMYDWHPAFYCMVLRVILTVWDSTYAVILVQYFFWAYVMIELLMYLRNKGMRDGVINTVALLSGINAGNFMHLNTIWKDIPYTLSVLWALIILAKLAIDFEAYKSKWYIYLELITALVGVCLYRKNGVVSFVVIVFSAVVVLRRNVKVWISVALSIILIGIVKGPIYNYFEIEDPGRHGMYIGLGQDILSVYYARGEVSEETMKMINVMTNYNIAEYTHTPTWSYQSYDLDVPPISFIKCYIDTFLRNPLTMMRAVIDREDAVWDIFKGQDSVLGCVNYSGTQDGKGPWNDYYPKRVFRSLYPQFSDETAYTASSQWISAIEWRCGLFTLIGILCFFTVIVSRGMCKELIMLAPIIGHILSLLLSTGWSDFRYFWPLNLMNMGVLLFVMLLRLQTTEEREA